MEPIGTARAPSSASRKRQEAPHGGLFHSRNRRRADFHRPVVRRFEANEGQSREGLFFRARPYEKVHVPPSGLRHR